MKADGKQEAYDGNPSEGICIVSFCCICIVSAADPAISHFLKYFKFLVVHKNWSSGLLILFNWTAISHHKIRIQL